LTAQASFSRYGKAFQEGLVQLIYEDRPFADQITEVLDINFLELEYLRVLLIELSIIEIGTARIHQRKRL